MICVNKIKKNKKIRRHSKKTLTPVGYANSASCIYNSNLTQLSEFPPPSRTQLTSRGLCRPLCAPDVNAPPNLVHVTDTRLLHTTTQNKTTERDSKCTQKSKAQLSRLCTNVKFNWSDFGVYDHLQKACCKKACPLS